MSVKETRPTRPTAHQIFDRVLISARDELGRSSRGLAFSGFAAGLGMGLTGIAVAAAAVALGEQSGDRLPALLLYPTGFVVVIVGRQQLFTENTLYPVALVLDERRLEHVLNTVRLWVVVFVSNVLGALAFAGLLMHSGAVGRATRDELARLGERAVEGTWWGTFASAIVAGWLIALVAWLVTAGADTIGQVALTWLLAFVVGAAHLAHCIATSAEILCSTVAGGVSAGSYLSWLAAATLGNILGGVFIVTILNYGQVVAGEGNQEP